MLTKVQIIDTALMRLGNRQGNATLQAQALIEWELLLEELANLPVLPQALAFGATFSQTRSAGTSVAAFSGLIDVISFGYYFSRLTPQDSRNSPVTLLSYAGESDYQVLVPFSEEQYNAAVNEDWANTAGKPQYYYAREYIQTAGGITAVAPYVTIFPNVTEEACVLGFTGFAQSTDKWRAISSDLLVAGIGKRMAPYVRDPAMLQLFTQEFARVYRGIVDRETAINEGEKYGLRGDLEDR